MKKQYVPIVAIFYQDVEPYKISEWDNYWDGGKYEVLIVLDGDWDSEEFGEQRFHIASASNNAESKFGDLYADTFLIGYWINGIDDFWEFLNDEEGYQRFMVNNGQLVYATNSFWKKQKLS